MKSERRHQLRYAVTLQIVARQLHSLEDGGENVHESFHANAENISTGGVCLTTKQRMFRGSLVCCQFSLPGIPSPVPALMRVQWVRKTDSRNFRAGLNYLFSAETSMLQPD